MRKSSTTIQSILLFGLLVAPLIGSHPANANSEYPCLTAPLSKLTSERTSNGADFQIRLINSCGTTNQIKRFPLILTLDAKNGPTSTDIFDFNAKYPTVVNFHFSNEQLLGLSTINLRPALKYGTQVMDLGSYVFHFICLELSNQETTLDKNPLSQNAFLDVTLYDSCFNQHQDFIWDAIVDAAGSKTYMKVSGRGTIGISGVVSGEESKAVTPTLRLFDKDGNSVVFTLKRFTANSLAWTKNLKTCASGLQIKTQCDEFPGVSFEFCSPLEDYKISEFDGKKWISPNERFQGEKDLDRCKSTKPFYIYYSAANESLTKVNKVRFIFYATPTQKAQTWEIQIKTVKKK